jgi:hypothetical protein
MSTLHTFASAWMESATAPTAKTKAHTTFEEGVFFIILYGCLSVWGDLHSCLFTERSVAVMGLPGIGASKNSSIAQAAVICQRNDGFAVRRTDFDFR